MFDVRLKTGEREFTQKKKEILQLIKKIENLQIIQGRGSQGENSKTQVHIHNYFLYGIYKLLRRNKINKP